MKVVGIDLAGKVENPTGFCLLTESGSQTKLLFSDMEILKEVEEIKPDCIAVDAPFWIPRFGAWRPSDEKIFYNYLDFTYFYLFFSNSTCSRGAKIQFWKHAACKRIFSLTWR